MVISQEYFNERYPYTLNNCVFDYGLNGLEVEDGYVINGVTGDSNCNDWNRLAIAKFNNQGNLLFAKNWGSSDTRWYNGGRGSLISHLGSFYSIGNKVTYFDDGSLGELMLVKYNSGFDTVCTAYYGEQEHPYDTTYVARNFKGVENIFIVTGTLQILHDLDMKDALPNKNLDPDFVTMMEKWYSSHDIFLLSLDSLGNHIWENVFPDSTYRGEGNSVIQTPDGGYVIGAHKWYIGQFGVAYGDPIVIKTDSLGNKEWEVNLGTSWPDGTAIVCNSIDSNIVVAASVAVDSGWNHFYERAQVTKLDLSGNILWNNLYGPSSLDNSFNVSNIRQDSIGGFIISGRTSYSEVWPDEPSLMGYMLRINNNGDSLWYRQYANLWGKQSENYFYDAIPTSDGGFLGAGTVLPFNPDTGNRDAWIIKVDSMGCTSLTDCWVGEPEWKWLETESDNKIKVYPNPAHNWFEVEPRLLSGEGKLEVEVFDLYGRKTEEIEMPSGEKKVRIYTSEWNRGVYLVRVKSGSEVLGSGKVVLE